MLTFKTSRGVIARWVVPALSIPPTAQTPKYPYGFSSSLTLLPSTPPILFKFLSLNVCVYIYIYFLLLLLVTPDRLTPLSLSLSLTLRNTKPPFLVFHWLTTFRENFSIYRFFFSFLFKGEKGEITTGGSFPFYTKSTILCLL
jgi:hypothetical protein